MNTPNELPNDMKKNRIVYVRPIDIEDLPEEVKLQMPDASDIYSVNAANGDRLALVRGQKLAFVLARQNDMQPVHVH